MASQTASRRWRTLKAIALAVIAVGCAALLDRNTFFGRTIRGPIAQFDPTLSDFVVYHLFHPPPPTGEVAIAAIDDRSLARLGRFPWPREVEARLVDALRADGAKVIAFDIFFSEPDPEDTARQAVATELHAAGVPITSIRRAFSNRGDDALAAAMRAQGSVFIAYAFNPHLSFQHPVSYRSATETPLLDPPPVAYNLVVRLPGAHPATAIAYDYIAPEAELNRAARGTGYVDIDEDEADGRMRSYPAAVLFRGRYAAPLFLAATQAFLGDPLLKIGVGANGIASVALGDQVISVDEMGRMMIHYRGAAGTIPRYSVADIIDGCVPASDLRGKMVLVGVTAHALGDRIVTPVGSDFPGVEMQATAADNVLRGDFIHRSVAERGEEKLAGWLLGICIGVVAGLMSAGVSLLLLLLATLGYFAYVLFRFEAGGALVGLMFPLVAVFFSYLAATSYRYFAEGREKRYLRSAFEMYLHPAVLASVIEDPAGLKLGGQRRHLSVLFADIVGFTERAERLDPEPLVALLNTYMSVMTEVILKSGGVVDKLMGDGIMAFWGPPLKMENHARAAISCALEMLDALKRLGEKDERFRDVRIGIGIATGDAIVGNLGGERHFDYSAVGDTVNLASRIEGLTRHFAVNLLVNRAALSEAGAGYIARNVGLVRVKGRDRAEEIFEVVGREGDGVDPSYYERFNRAVAPAANGKPAEQMLRALLAERPDDRVAAMYLEQLRESRFSAAHEVIFEFDSK